MNGAQVGAMSERVVETMLTIKHDISAVKHDHYPHNNGPDCELCMRSWPCAAIRVAAWLERFTEGR